VQCASWEEKCSTKGAQNLFLFKFSSKQLGEIPIDSSFAQNKEEKLNWFQFSSKQGG
jgi:hypothetical protein